MWISHDHDVVPDIAISGIMFPAGDEERLLILFQIVQS